MTFREFLALSEQGTKPSSTGIGAGGRAGQSQATPEKPVTAPPSVWSMGTKNLIKPDASPFNPSSKLLVKPKQPSPFNVSFKPNYPEPPGPFSVRGFGTATKIPKVPPPSNTKQ